MTTDPTPDIAQRARDRANKVGRGRSAVLLIEAADEIERLRAALPLIAASPSLKERNEMVGEALDDD